MDEREDIDMKEEVTHFSTNSFFNALAGGGMATLSYLIGGVDNIVVALSFFMIIDYATGIMVGISVGKVSSQRAYRGLFKKIGMLLMIVVAVQVDLITGNDSNFMRNSIIMLLIATEGISLLENLGKLGVPIPQSLTNALESMKSDTKKGETKDGNKRQV